MSNLGKLAYYSGIEVHKKYHCISLCHSCFAAKILENGGMVECNSA